MNTSVLLSYHAQQRPGSFSAYGSFCRPYGANVVCGSRVAGVPRCALHPCLNPVAPHGAICSKLKAHGLRLIAHLALCLIVAALLVGCRGGGSVAGDARLLAIDSIVDTDSVAAWRQLQAIDSASLTTDADRHLYALLHQQILYKQYQQLDTVVLSRLCDYYDAHPDGNRLTRTLLLSGGAREDAGKLPEAIPWYKRAEDVALQRRDTFNLAYAKMRTAICYGSSYTQDSIHFVKYKEALALFHAVGSSRYECACLTDLGTLYRINNNDSAFHYLSKALSLACEMSDSARIYENLALLSGYYYCVKDFARSKDVAVMVINKGVDIMPQRHVSATYINAAFSYAKLGMPDSARYYFDIKPPAAQQGVDEMNRHHLLSLIAQKEGNTEEFIAQNLAEDEISDSILLASLQVKIREVEARYDKSQAELNALTWRNKFLVVTLLAVLLLAMLALVAYHLLTRERRNRVQIATLQTELQSLSREVGRHEGLNAELREALMRELAADQEMLLDYYTVGKVPKTYHHKMEERLRSPQFIDTLWQSILTIADSEHNGFVTRLREAFPQLREEDVRFLVLERCDFSREFVKFLLGYDNARSVDTRRARLARRMGLDKPLRKWLENF